MLKRFWRLLRPLQWVKNIFVFTGLLFSNEYEETSLLIDVCIVFVAFCFTSSCVYIFNDIYDRESDRLHPVKQFRPIAAGEVSVPAAIALAILMGSIGMALGWMVSKTVVIILGIYLLMNLWYSIRLKHIVLLDVFCISAGFMLRIAAGTIGVDIVPSKWLLLCGMMITLFLGFAKRRAELFASREERREVLQKYSPVVLEEVLAICAACAILTYSLYTMSGETVRIHHTNNLIYTVPFVIYALFRYIFLLHQRDSGEDPTKDLLKDPHIVLSVAGWALLTLFLVKVL